MVTTGCPEHTHGRFGGTTSDAGIVALIALAALTLAATSAFAEDAASAGQEAQASRCIVHHQPFMEAGVAHGTMRLVNDGKPCGFTFQFGMNFAPDTWTTDVAPRHGHLHFDRGRVEYLPDADYAGSDAFTITAFGMNPMLRGTNRRRNGQFAFDVDVRAAKR
ncbi:MAG TPA: hypothetical protein VF925_12570 [Casimicrobiaceae bacterium]